VQRVLLGFRQSQAEVVHVGLDVLHEHLCFVLLGLDAGIPAEPGERFLSDRLDGGSGGNGSVQSVLHGVLLLANLAYCFANFFAIIMLT